MNKTVFPALLVATIMVAGAFAFAPVEQATTVHTSGAVVADSSAFLLGGANAVSTAGATVVSLTEATTEWTTTGASTATLANGTPGQLLLVVLDVDGGDQVLTIATAPAAADVITFADAGDMVLLAYSTVAGWQIVVNIGAAAA